MERWLDGSPATRLDKPATRAFDAIGSEVAIVTPIMEVRAPRGEMIIYKSDPVWDDTKSEAIKAFMEEHKDD